MRLTTFYRLPVFFGTGLIAILFAGIWGPMPVHAAPSAFSLLLPENGATISTSVLLDWEDSTDPGGVTYMIYLSKDDNSFAAPIMIESSDSTRLLKEADGIQDSSTYYWKVQAINPYGAVYDTQVFQFSTDSGNPVPAWIGGYIKDANNKPIANATVNVSVWNQTFPFTTDSKGYFLGELKPKDQINPGAQEDVTIDIKADGYQTITAFSMQVTLNEVTTADDFTLLTAPVRGDVNGDREVNLKDAVLVLQILTGENPSGIQKEAALNQDQKIGLPELVYILRKSLNSN